MRLIELRLTNLNSLKGNWRIDFTHEAFVNEGIFAITGQTGAGKTTILDAICLALYSQTPRLGKITGTANDIMTQGTGECAAEVVIELGGKQYCCSWYQHRAYKKAGGKLAAIRHQINELPSGNILEDSASKTAPFIQNLLGMDFDQFTRSIMLAQGSFAAFLKSDIANRAALLEKITGTAIYAKISKQVFEKFRDEKNHLAQLESNIAHLPVLSLEDEQAFKESLSQLSDKQSQRRDQLQTLTEQLRWLEQISKLTQQLTQHQNALDDAQWQHEAFAPDNLRLIAANRALEIDSVYQTLSLNRRQCDTLLQEKTALDERAPVLFDAKTMVKQTLAQCVDQEKIALDDLQNKQPLLKKVRQLDSQILQVSNAIDEEKTRQSALTMRLSTLNLQIDQQQHAVKENNQHLIEVQNYLNEHSHHLELTADMPIFQENAAQLSSYLEDKIKTVQKKAQLEIQAREGQAKLTALGRNRDAISAQLQHNQQQVDKLTQALGNQNKEQLQHQRYLLENHLEKLGVIEHNLQRLRAQSTQINDLNQNQAQLSQQIQQSDAEMSQQQDTIKAAMQRRQDKQAQWQLLQKVAKLEDYIADLEAGAPCPLCGATEHPYQNAHPLLRAATHSSDNKELQVAILTLDDTITCQQQQLSALQIQHAKMTASFEHHNRLKPAFYQESLRLVQDAQVALMAIAQSNAESKAAQTISSEIATPLKALKRSFEPILNSLNDNQPATDNHQSTLDLAAIEQSLEYLNELSRVITAQKTQTVADQQTLAQHNAAMDQMLQIIANNQKQLAQIDQDQLQLTAELTLNQNNLDHRHQQIANQHHQILAIMTKLITLSQKYLNAVPIHSWQNLKQKIANQDPITDQECWQVIEDCQPFNQQLLHWQSQFLAKKEAQSTLSQQQSQLQANINAQTAQRQHDIEALDAMARALNDKVQQQHSWQSERERLFGSSNPDEELARLQQVSDDAKANLAIAHRKLDATIQQLQLLSDQQAKLDATIISAKAVLAQQEVKFKQALIEAQFSDEAAFCQALLPKTERDVLNQQKLALDHTLSQAKSQLARTKTELELTQSKALTKQNLPEIALQQEALQADFDRALSEIGAINQKLLDNDQQKAAQSVQLLNIQQQKEHLRVWQQLYDLIGSADGKKYRTFAQSLTFEVMINHANQQLQKMSDRYLLIHDSEQPLELSVIDNYQGGEIRSTKNLSGGEGFIISLALALGLSQMASQNIRVDSLFLDEGFGTLDEESLDIALDTLTGLQQEGKLIGVISHVSALKARILTQIQVNKRAGGISVLTGHGCQALAAT
ncbi:MULTISPECIES: AAA family ATPase [Psychrobacter]|uniref:AAA family ATPase n=1 Tax=Psychrobacter TaxID=497 RepID=UPI00146B5E2C|nr:MULTISPECIES: AAA family ATPase [Psychrobacter]